MNRVSPSKLPLYRGGSLETDPECITSGMHLSLATLGNKNLDGSGGVKVILTSIHYIISTKMAS